MSNLLKVARAVDSDDWWVKRIAITCDLLTIPYTRDTAIKATLRVATQVRCEQGAICTETISDADLIAAVGNATGKQEAAAGLIATLPPTENSDTDLPVGIGSDDMALEVEALHAQVEILGSENRVLAAKVAAFEGNETLAASLLTNADTEIILETPNDKTTKTD